MTNSNQSPKSGRYSLREYRARIGGAVWRLMFQPAGMTIKPGDFTVMTMQPGEVLPTGKRLQLSEKLLQVALPFSWEYDDLRCATAAYLQIYEWHDAAHSAGPIAKPAAFDAE